MILRFYEGCALRNLLLALGLAIATAGIGTAAHAQNYPWCAIYNVGDNSQNCGFVTEAQCRVTVSGIGGFCMRNTTYDPSLPLDRSPYSSRGSYLDQAR